MSMPALVGSPNRNITRRSVTTKCVVRHLRKGQSASHPTTTSQITAITDVTTVLNVESHSRVPT